MEKKQKRISGFEKLPLSSNSATTKFFVEICPLTLLIRFLRFNSNNFYYVMGTNQEPKKERILDFASKIDPYFFF